MAASPVPGGACESATGDVPAVCTGASGAPPQPPMTIRPRISADTEKSCIKVFHTRMCSGELDKQLSCTRSEHCDLTADDADFRGCASSPHIFLSARIRVIRG